ncbi:MAG: hypothetical protein ACREOK_14220 [Gemmatimonadaceae bacterium]
MTTPSFDTRRARLAAYIPWMLRDYLTNQGPATLIVVLLIGYMGLLPVIELGASLGDVPADMAGRLLLAIIPAFAFLGPFFATNGIIANDRKFSYYRFLFSKPVSPIAYYVTMFLVYGVGVFVVTLALMGIWSIVVRPMLPMSLFAVVGIMYVAFGGIGFLLSAAWRFDWLSLVTVLLVASVAWEQWGDAQGIARLPLYLLPQVHRASDIYAMVVARTAAVIPWSAILWVGGYGFVCFLLGMVVIRRRPLGTT